MNRRYRIALFTVLGAVLAVATMAGALWASTLSSHYVPETVNYQGYLTDSGGDPISGTVTLNFSIWDASSGGSSVWNETHTGVSVVGGYFSVLLGSEGTPLGPDYFKGTPRYLQVTYDGTTFPRQVFASVPYALVSHYAVEAGEAISSTYAYTATYAMSSGSSSGSSGVEWENVVVVAKSGGDYDTIGAALAAISPSSSSRYLVLVMPGVYTEQVTIPGYVHVKGAGTHTTVISSASAGQNGSAASSTVTMEANSHLSDIGVYNTYANTASNNDDNITGIRIATGNENTVLRNVRVRNVDGGFRNNGIFMSGGTNPKLYNVHVEVSGGGFANWGLTPNATEPDVYDSYIRASGTGSVAVHTIGGAGSYTNTTLDGTNGSDGVGVNTSGGSDDQMYFDRSSILGDSGGNSFASTDDYDFYVGASKLGGPPAVAGVGNPTITCAQSYDTNYDEVSNVCTSP